MLFLNYALWPMQLFVYFCHGNNPPYAPLLEIGTRGVSSTKWVNMQDEPRKADNAMDLILPSNVTIRETFPTLGRLQYWVLDLFKNTWYPTWAPGWLGFPECPRDILFMRRNRMQLDGTTLPSGLVSTSERKLETVCQYRITLFESNQTEYQI